MGREIQDNYYRSDYDDYRGKEPVISVRNLTMGKTIRNISFELKKGEILGIGGLTDSGMHELGLLFSGLKNRTAGRLCLHKQEKG